MGAFLPDGSCGALLAGVCLPCRVLGVPGLAINVSNSVLDPKLGRSLLGARLFLQVVDEFLRRFGRDGVRLVYGLPNPSLVRAMSVHLGIEVLGDVYALARELAHTAPDRGRSATIRIEGSTDLPPDTDALWARCRDERECGLERTRAVLEWRYASHPTIGYHVVVARGDAGDLRGLMVTRVGGWRPDILSICEWLVPDADRDTEAALIEHALDSARRRGMVGLAASMSANLPLHRRWQVEHGFFAHPTSHQIVFRSFAAEVDRALLFDHWRLSMTDLEFL